MNAQISMPSALLFGAVWGLVITAGPTLAQEADGACCKPDGTCENLTEAECELVLPLSEARLWQAGLSCGEADQRCPHPACYAATGDCDVEHVRRCNGGPDDGDRCSADTYCASTRNGTCETLSQSICVDGAQAGGPCVNDLDCIPGGLCASKVCVDGARDGAICEGLRDCRESWCEASPGCSDPYCCDAVCNFSPGPPLYTDFCCEVHWDVACAELARDYLCFADCNDNGIPDEDDISSGTSSDSNLNDIPDECEVGACCDNSDGTCVDDVVFSDCDGSTQLRYVGITCAQITCAVGVVPTASEWGLVATALLGLAFGTVLFRRTRPHPA